MSTALPVTIELCARLRDGLPCLGRIHRSGVPEISSCTACGRRGDGVFYVLTPAMTLSILIAARAWRTHLRGLPVDGRAFDAEAIELIKAIDAFTGEKE